MSRRGKITLVFFFFAICTMAAWARYWDRRENERIKPSELFDIVREQLQACRNGDYRSAYRWTAATVREKCTPERYADQARNENARLAQAARVEFGPWQCRGRHAVVEVFFIGREGSVTPRLYSLVFEGEAWKIEGTRWLAPSRSSPRMSGLRS